MPRTCAAPHGAPDSDASADRNDIGKPGRETDQYLVLTRNLQGWVVWNECRKDRSSGNWRHTVAARKAKWKSDFMACPAEAA
jgi:hypothetical protein